MDSTFKTQDVLHRLCESPGVSSYETRPGGPIETLAQVFREYGFKSKRDWSGALVAQRGNGPIRVLITAHIDEVGFTVANILPDGRITVIPIGSINPGFCVGQEVRIAQQRMSGDDDIVGMMTTLKNPATDTITWNDCFVDIGASAEISVTVLGIRPGDMVYWPRRFYMQHDELLTYITSPALDNRVGATVMAGAFCTATIPKWIPLYAVAAPHHEQGNAYGGFRAASLVKPHFALVLDSAYAQPLSLQSTKTHWSIPRLGKGPAIQKIGTDFIVSDTIFRRLVSLAEITVPSTFQYEFPDRDTGGTDYVGVARAHDGVPTGVINTPVRYQHTPLSMATIEDIKASITLVRALLELNPNEYIPSTKRLP